jgi:hypothetical protein
VEIHVTAQGAMRSSATTTDWRELSLLIVACW